MKYNDNGDRERDVGDSHAPDVSHSSGLCPENWDARKEKKKRKQRRFEKGGTTKV